MSKIHQLPDIVINQIAAGEVVERPSSVVKELVENSLDAGASRVDVYIEHGGKKLIRIIDNGSGIESADLPGAVKRHWTSKIESTDDFTKLQTFGFRGEALASIAAVSRFELKSRVKDADEGYRLTIEDNQPSVRPVGMPGGTEIVIADLFYNVPARLNFLRQDSTEAAHIQELMYQLALIYPDVSFSFYRDGRRVFQSLGNNDTRHLLTAVLGEQLAEMTVPIRAEHPQLQIVGWIGQPGTGSSSRPRQYAFVNNRIVDNRIIWSAVQEGYRSLLGRHEKPQFIIRIDIAPHLVDVNVHPQKREVKFTNNQLIFQLIRQAVGSALMDRRVTSENNQESSEDIPSVVAPPTYTSPRFNQPSLGYSERNSAPRHVSDQSVAFDLTGMPTSPLVMPKQVKAFQLLDLFIVEELSDGVAVYDQHAVHERVLYERFVENYLQEKDQRSIQPLLMPELVEISPAEMATWEESADTLTAIGFDIEPMGDTTLRVNAVPAVLAKINIREVLNEVLSDLSSASSYGESEVKGVDDQTHRRLAYLACRSAIKAGDSLRQDEVIGLLKDFDQTTVNMTCPHGRPVRVEFSRREMEKWFKR